MLGFKHFEEEAHKAKNDPNKQKIDKKLHVFWDIDFQCILGGFWEGFGRPKSSIFAIFTRKNGREAKNEMIFGRLKNRILRPQEQTADEVRRAVRVRGKEYKDGGTAFELGI